ncbi:hypothetical protein GYMLUDRAFT_96989 [Collybiopsis luxurians FD-317 M1]|uniref:ER membrane protein complex subunit 1 n=1 Tax=Collybiopsis luxurians FD-317 M1 TaxID=944289 RepID=A0A0D0CXC9_9AGAR|nr:hypothetical protein GYMLUDRAFT_96989 [Collybiopsis luxurians FD-317 M1]
MRLHAFLLLLSLLATCSLALHESDVGVVDWHKELVGVPNTASKHTSPTFHRAPERLGRNTKSLVISATQSNVLAVLDPVNGTVAWRYVYEPRDNIVTFQKLRSVVASLSGAGGATLRSFNVLNGELLLEKRLHDPETGLLIQPNYLGTFVAFGNTTRDLYTLTNGRTVTYISSDVNYSNGGDIVWTWTSEDHSSQVLYSTVYATGEVVYVVGLASSFATYTLHVTSLSATSGQVLASTSIPSSISSGLDDFIVSSDSIVWLENGVLKSFALSSSLKGKPVSIKGPFERISDVGLGSQSMFVAVREDGSSQIVTSQQGNLAPTQEFKALQSNSCYFSGGFDKDGHHYVSRTCWSPTMKAASVELYAPHRGGGKDAVIEYTLPFDANTHGAITHVAMDVVNSESDVIRGRLLLTTSTGAVQLWEQGEHVWTREEGLSEVNAAKFVDLPERVSVLSGDSSRSEEGFVGRLIRQIRDAKDLPDYILRFVKRFATGSYESATSSATVIPPASSASDPQLQLPFRDAFGFRQVLVVSTAYGKVYGIDTSNGEILWSRILGAGEKAKERGARVVPVEGKMFVFKTVADADDDAHTLEAAGPEVVLVAKTVSEESTSEEVLLFHFSAPTGDDVLRVSGPETPLEGASLTSQGLSDAYVLQHSGKKIVVVLDSQFKAHLYPHDSTAKAIFAAAAANTSLSVPLRVNSPHGQRRLAGHQFSSKTSIDQGAGETSYDAYPTWTLSLPEGQDIQSIITPVRDPVASIGKVLGNRTTLYKYLNPHIVLVLTAPHSSSSSALHANDHVPAHCGLYLVDSVKGSVVYQTILPTERGGSCNVKASFVENWLVYHYYDSEYQGPDQTKGYRMVTVELYEGKQVDEKTKSSELSSFSDKMMDITAYEQSFVYPHAISAIAHTSTKFGITSKDVIVANVNGKIQSFSRRLLNPRRPVGRKPSSEEQEEFLVQYDPVLPDDPRKVLSHNYDVSNTRSIITSPALLESTSLVFAYGLDLFLTRVAPSNTFDVLSENFNKVQLVLTVTGLAAAIFVTRPMVKRKKLREKWYN